MLRCSGKHNCSCQLCRKEENNDAFQVMNISSVLECVEALLNYSEFTDVAQAIFQESKKLIGATAGYVALLDKEAKYNEILFLDKGGMICQVDTSLPMPVRGLRAKVYQTGKTIYENDFADSSWTKLLPQGHITIENVMFIPLIYGDKVIGLLGLGNKQGGFTAHDAEIGTAFGQFASVALNNKKIMDRLTDSEEKYRRLVEFIPEGIFVVCEEKVIFANSTAAALLGANSPEQIVGKSLPEIIHSDYLDIVRKNAPLILSQQLPATPLEIKLVCMDGSTVDVDFLPTSFTYEGKPTVLIAARDVTQRKLLEQESLNATKLEAISVLAGGIAHDFNNLLTVVLGNLSMAKMYAAKESPLFIKLAEIESAALQTKDLTHQLLTFTKGQTLQKKAVYIEELLGETIPFLLRGTNIKVKFDFADNLPAVEIDSAQISQVINNLIINAIQAMPDGGTITVETRHVRDSLQRLLGVDGQVRIVFSDEGFGIPAEHLSRIFEPFFTTKINGNGLGLATSYNIIKQHGGYMRVESSVGVGTAFTVYLPATTLAVVEQERCFAEILVVERGKVLVMDDDEGVRKTLSEMLGLLGFDVECAATGEEAVFHYQLEQDRGQGFDFVILDMTVRGGMGGEKTLSHLQSLNPNVKALISSGYVNAELLTDYGKHGFIGFVSKPYKIEELSAILKNIV